VERKISLLIDHQCPQCGAPATLTETDRLFRCEFCRVSSYLTPRACFRYILPHKASVADKDIIYFPYWRFRGMLFWCLPSGVDSRVADVSQQAVDVAGIPPSLGLRSQTLKMKFVTQGTPGRFIPPALPFDTVMRQLDTLFNAEKANRAVCQARVGDVTSLIYAPFHGADPLYDAVLDQPLSTQPPVGFDLSTLLGKHPGMSFDFIPAICSKCGWDLEGHRESLALSCPNCRSLWQARGGKFGQLTTAFLPDTAPGTIYLPFWRVKAAVSGVSLNTYADLARLVNLPRAIQSRWENAPFYFWGPAFKVRPKTYLRLCTQFTVGQPLDPLSPGMPDAPLHPVSMPLSEYIDSLMIVLASLVKPLRAFVEKSAGIQIKAQSYRLTYLPFQESGLDYVQPQLNLAVNKNQLALATAL
jgi:predicted RNA-binding Zn-ribbon protein involved in translation (DUF1610 family)